MSTENGNGKGRILSLDEARTTKTRKGNDFITVQQAYDMVIQECAKVHEFYLQQIPTFTARMIQDALLTYGLIQPQPGVDIAPQTTEGNADASAAGGDAAVPADADNDPSGPADTGALPLASDPKRPADSVAPASGDAA